MVKRGRIAKSARTAAGAGLPGAEKCAGNAALGWSLMRDLDDLELDLGRLPEIRQPDAQSPSAAQQIRRALRGKHVCPFCGTQRETDVGACMHCSLEDTPTTRTATRGKLGPWYVLQSRNPSAPGMNFATLMVLVQKGKVSARSVLRGPTTGQFWRHAAKVKGVSREFSLCWNCGGDVSKAARACPNCKRLQEPPLNPDVLLENGEFSSEELAEAMWADQTPESSQMGAPAAPRSAASPVDRLVARGGVRREVASYPNDLPPGTLPPRPERGLLSDTGLEELPPTGVEMAVFQMPQRPGTPRRGGGAMGKIFKSVFVAVMLSTLGVAAMCTLDESFRRKCVGLAQKARDSIKALVSGVDPAAKPMRGLQTEPTLDDADALLRGKMTSTSASATTDRGQPATLGAREADSSAAIPAVPADRAAPLRPTIEQAKMRVWELWKAGNAAEQRSDFAGAVKSWEAIKALPVKEDDLPLTLDAKIAAAKQRAK